MTDHLPDVDMRTPTLTSDQEKRACDMSKAMAMSHWGLYSAARLIVHLQDQLAKPAHEREPPHCSTCSCGMPAEPSAAEPDMLHPKIQVLIRQKARLEIERNMVAEIIKDGPDADLYGLSDYETELHDQLREKLRAPPGDRLRDAERLLRAAYEGDESKWPEIGHWLAQCTPETTEGGR